MKLRVVLLPLILLHPKGGDWIARSIPNGTDAASLDDFDDSSTLASSSKHHHEALTLSTASLAERSLPRQASLVRARIGPNSTYRHAIYSSPYRQGHRRPATAPVRKRAKGNKAAKVLADLCGAD